MFIRLITSNLNVELVLKKIKNINNIKMIHNLRDLRWKSQVTKINVEFIFLVPTGRTFST